MFSFPVCLMRFAFWAACGIATEGLGWLTGWPEDADEIGAEHV